METVSISTDGDGTYIYVHVCKFISLSTGIWRMVPISTMENDTYTYVARSVDEIFFDQHTIQDSSMKYLLIDMMRSPYLQMENGTYIYVD